MSDKVEPSGLRRSTRITKPSSTAPPQRKRGTAEASLTKNKIAAISADSSISAVAPGSVEDGDDTPTPKGKRGRGRPKKAKPDDSKTRSGEEDSDGRVDGDNVDEGSGGSDAGVGNSKIRRAKSKATLSRGNKGSAKSSKRKNAKISDGSEDETSPVKKLKSKAKTTTAKQPRRSAAAQSKESDEEDSEYENSASEQPSSDSDGDSSNDYATKKPTAKPKKVPATYAAGTGGKPTAEQMQIIQSSTVPALKDMLRRNLQSTSLKKAELQSLIIECIREGCYPKCPDCGTARLKRRSTKGSYYCPGWYDDEGAFQTCGFKGDAERIPWVCAEGQPI
ncbi:hypothetical protein DFJ73DRAFT_845783 [Zopfochytrium polystomum]|nr:hypothetical protein DFJ73DRAFT_845783 [Zopfochytrium polystomum]